MSVLTPFQNTECVEAQLAGHAPCLATGTRSVKCEHPDSINDSWLTDSWPGGGGWGDLAASYHDGACGIGFADGHGEIHKWKDKGTLQPVTKKDTRAWSTYAPNDTTWFMTRTTAPIQ